MNFKKIKESLISAVIGSSLLLVNGGVVCQQPKAWLSDGFIDSETKKYAHNPKMTKIINILKLFSDLHKKPKHAKTLPFIHQKSILYDKEIVKKDLSKIQHPEKQVLLVLRTLLSKALIIATAPGGASIVMELTDATILTMEQILYCLYANLTTEENTREIFQKGLSIMLNELFDVLAKGKATPTIEKLKTAVNNLLDSE